jgi:agmatinase
MREDYKALGLSCFGPASFLKAPITTPEAGWSAEVAFLGIPFDQATGFRSGARWGPRAIRNISVRFSAVSAPGQPGYFDLRSGLDRATCRVVDCGDVEIVPLLWETDFEMITGAVGAILAKGAFPLIAGGDHAVTFPCVRAFEGRGPITVVQIDAHLDYRDEAMGVRYGHGNVLRRVRELPFVERIVSVGVRSLRTRREDAKAHQDDGNTIISAWDLHVHGIDALAGLLPRNADVYVTFDIDAMDPAIAPGTGTPEVGGLCYEQARRLMEIVFAENRIVGFDLVEMNPSLDPSEITALLSAQIMLEAIGFLHHRREGTTR